MLSWANVQELQAPGRLAARLGFTWLVAFPTLLLVLPVVRRVVGLLVAAPRT